MRIAIDAMGGDLAPRETVAGAIAGLAHVSEQDRIVLVGREDRIRAELDALEYANNGMIEIVHAADVIEMGDHPVEALKQKRDNSIGKMTMLASKREIQAMISAGNTGACVASCQLKLRTLEGVHRPGIAVAFPSFGGPLIMCDVGANPAPKPHHMRQYALMCTLYAQELFEVPSPRVALLSIGEEEAKGNPLVRQVRDILTNDERINFVGYIEGRNLLSGQAEVVVCDGFTGNVAIKIIEGLAAGLVRKLAEEIAEQDPALAEASKPILRSLLDKHDYSEYGGAPLLGVDGIFIICHGASDRRAISNAVKVAYKLAGSKVNERIVAFFRDERAASSTT